MQSSSLLKFQRPTSYQFGSQDVLDKYCGKGKFKTLDMCYNPQFLNPLCSQYPFQFTRVLRIDVNMTAKLLERENMNDVKMIYVARDPRAIFHSRQMWSVCAANTFCSNIELLCEDMTRDFYNLMTLQKLFPKSYM